MSVYLFIYNLLLSAGTATLEIEPISEKPRVLGFIFILFICCFFLTSILFGQKRKMLSSMANELSHVKVRQSLFYVEVGNELYSKLLLCVQSCILLSVFAYYW